VLMDQLGLNDNNPCEYAQDLGEQLAKPPVSAPAADAGPAAGPSTWVSSLSTKVLAGATSGLLTPMPTSCSHRLRNILYLRMESFT
jgi:hypothetical protein